MHLKSVLKAEVRALIRPLWRPVSWRMSRHVLTATAEINGRLNELDQRIQQLHGRLDLLSLSSTPALADHCHARPAYLAHRMPYPIFNPGVIRWNDEILFVSRCSNLLVRDDSYYVYGSKPHDTANVFHRYSERLEVIESHLLDDRLLRKNCRAAECGIEDLRLFSWQGALWAIGAGVRVDDMGFLVSQILIRIDQWKIVEFIELNSPVGARREKNWIPLVRDDKLFLIYCFDPLIVFEYREGRLLPVTGAPAAGSELRMRGGTPLLGWGEYYVGIVHAPLKIIDGKGYLLHHFIVLNENFELIEVSRPFHFQRLGVEFACGLIEFKGDLLVSYGVSDRGAAFAVFPIQRLAEWVVSLGVSVR